MASTMAGDASAAIATVNTVVSNFASTRAEDPANFVSASTGTPHKYRDGKGAGLIAAESFAQQLESAAARLRSQVLSL
jgi:hypothetical protein